MPGSCSGRVGRRRLSERVGGVIQRKTDCARACPNNYRMILAIPLYDCGRAPNEENGCASGCGRVVAAGWCLERSLPTSKSLLSNPEKLCACFVMHIHGTRTSSLCRARDWFRPFGIGSASLALDTHFMQLPQYIVVLNCTCAHEHQQVTPSNVFHSLLA